MSNKTTQSKSKTYASFTIQTLMKLAQVAANESHAGALSIFIADGEFKAVFGQGAPSQAADVAAHSSLKGALVALLVDAPAFANEFVTELPLQ